jgi:flagellar hook-length control protein FliK
MPSFPITPPTSARVGTAPKGASPPPGAPGDFAALLDQTSARTAVAEGPKNRPARPESQRRDAAAPKDDNKGAAGTDAQAAPVAEPAQPAAAANPAQGTQGQPATGDQAAPVAEQAAAVAASGVDQPAAAVVVPIPGLATPVAGTTTTVATTSPAPAVAVAAQAGAGVATALPAATNGASPGDAVATPADGTSAGKLQIPAELLNTNGGQTKDLKNGDQPQRDLPPAPTLPPTADAAAAPTPTPASTAAPIPAPAADPGVAPAPAAQAQPVATPQTAAVAVGNGAPQLSRASVLQTAERVQELVRIVATRAGNARAVLQLRPAELGQVDVHLRTTRNGLVATIAAHEQVGHDALQQAGNELRRTLEDKGVQLHSLDLQLGSGDNGFTNQGDAREASSGRRGAAAMHGLSSDDPVAEDELTLTHAPSSTPAGALVDVQA